MIHKDFQCEFYFIRHGESESNATPGFVAGANFDSPLTDKGFEHARLVGERLRQENVQFDRVYSSSLTRTVQTTETILKAMGQPERAFPRIDALVEQQTPGWRGIPNEQINTPENLAYIRGKGAHFVPPEGESLRMVQRRMANWLEDEIIYNQDLVEKERSLKVAIVGHGNASRCWFQYIMGFDDHLILRIRLDNCGISRFIFNKGGWSVVGINDSSHLNGTGQSQITP